MAAPRRSRPGRSPHGRVILCIKTDRRHICVRSDWKPSKRFFKGLVSKLLRVLKVMIVLVIFALAEARIGNSDTPVRDGKDAVTRTCASSRTTDSTVRSVRDFAHRYLWPAK